MSQTGRLHRILAFLIFFISFAVYVLTSYPTFSFGTSGALAFSATSPFRFHPEGTGLWGLIAFGLVDLIPGELSRNLVLFSAICSGAAAMLVYLATVRLFAIWNGIRFSTSEMQVEPTPSGKEPATRNTNGIALGAAALSGLSFAWFDASWVNGTGITNHSMGSLLTALILWLGLSWFGADRATSPGRANRVLFLAAFAGGAALGIDHIALGSLSAILLLLWIANTGRQTDSPWNLSVILAGAAIVIVLPFLFVNWIPGLHESLAATANSFQRLEILWLFLPVALLGILLWKPPVNRFAVWGSMALLLLLGYTSYYQRDVPDAGESIADIATKENSTDADRAPVGAVNSEGMRRAQAVADSIHHARTPSYNTGKLYQRAFLHNLVGRSGEEPNADVLWFSAPAKQSGDSTPGFPIRFFLFPLLLGLIGLIYHFRYDARTALVLTVMLIVTGPVTGLLAGGTDAAIDSAGLVGSSLVVVAIWIGIGGAGLAESMRTWNRQETAGEGPVGSVIERGNNLASGVLVLCCILGPLNLLYNGYTAHDRSESYMASDFAYNVLQSTEPNALLIVTDRNWGAIRYLQERKLIRRDVCVLDITQLESAAYRESAGRPDGTREATLRFLKAVYDTRNRKYQPLLDTLPVRRSATEVTNPTDPLSTGPDGQADETVESDSLHRKTIPFEWERPGIPIDSGRYFYGSRGLILEDIIREALRSRPVYFAITVQPEDWIGLDSRLRWEGLAFRVEPRPDTLRKVDGFSEFPVSPDRLIESLISRPPNGEYSRIPDRSYVIRGMNGSVPHYLGNERRMIPLYRRAFIALAADALNNRNNPDECLAVLDKMTEAISAQIYPPPYWTSAAIALLEHKAGRNIDGARSNSYARLTIRQTENLGDEWREDPVGRRYNPHQIRARMQALLGEYDAAIRSYEESTPTPESDVVIRGLIEELRVERHLVASDTAAALNELRNIIQSYGSPTDQGMRANLNAWTEMLSDLEREG